MSFYTPSNFYLSVERFSNKTFVEQPNREPVPPSPQAREGVGDISLILVPIGFLITLVFIILKVSRVQKSVHETITPFNCSQRVPCRNCQFFNQNFYLKCAVHPTLVLTEEAKQCSDFDPLPTLVKK